MAPPVKKARVDGAAAAKDAVDVDESREEQTQLEEQEADANPSKAPISHVVGFNVPDTTMNVMSNANVLKPLSEGGLQTLFGCARANVGLKNGRYMFEVQILEHPACADRNVKPGNLLKVGFATSTSSLFAGDSEDSLCFDSEGSLWCANKKTPICKRWGARGVVVAVLLNLDKNSSNYQTVSLFKDGVRMCPPQSLPEGLKSKTLFPAFTFRNITLHVNFGPDPLAPLPFKCNMISGAEKADAEIANVPEAPKDGKYEVLYPVCLPGEASYTWLELFMQKNPTYTDLSYKAIASWCKKSGIQGNTQIGDIAKKLKKTAPAQARNYVVFDLDRSFLADRRAQDLAHFPAALFKRIAATVVGDPTPDFVQHSQALLLKDKQVASDIEFKKRKEEERRKKVMDKKARELERTKKIAEKKRKRAVEEHQRKLAVMAKKAKIEAAKRAGKEVPEEDMEEEEEKAPEPEEEEVEEEEPAEVEEPEVEENPPTVELTPEDKAVKFYLPGNKPDMDPKFLGLSFAKFAMPSKEEGFAEIRHEWNKGSQAEEYLKTWISEKKQTTRVEDIKPSTWFKEQNIRWQKTLREWRGKVEAYRKVLVSKEQQKQQKETMKMKKAAAAKALALRKELEKKRKKELAEHNGEEYIEEQEKEEPAAEEPDEADEEEAPEVDLESVDVFGVEDVADVGQGMPLFMKFGPEDWTIMNLRFELSLLAHAFKKDCKDPDRNGIHVGHLNFYYQKYYHKELTPKTFGLQTVEEVINIVIDSVYVNSNIVESLLPEEMECFDMFVQLTEECRRHRNILIASGDESARLKVEGPKVTPSQTSQSGPKLTPANPQANGDARPSSKGAGAGGRNGGKGWNNQSWGKGGGKGWRR